MSSEDEHMARFLKRFGKLPEQLGLRCDGCSLCLPTVDHDVMQNDQASSWLCAEGLSAAGLPGRLGQDKAEAAADS